MCKNAWNSTTPDSHTDGSRNVILSSDSGIFIPSFVYFGRHSNTFKCEILDTDDDGGWLLCLQLKSTSKKSLPYFCWVFPVHRHHSTASAGHAPNSPLIMKLKFHQWVGITYSSVYRFQRWHTIFALKTRHLQMSPMIIFFNVGRWVRTRIRNPCNLKKSFLILNPS